MLFSSQLSNEVAGIKPDGFILDTAHLEIERISETEILLYHLGRRIFS